ncbi:MULTISPECIES: DUF4381 family protein [unclassified Achromobacter]|uniref:DUF4381 family protein n=1 Tax=unclassified Achromobacter TaxID=2626865 RepID=UPI00069D9F7F|nr:MULTISPECIES: DUF4381 family protein [unclassified Achromobacter]KOF52423.1 hypothetical protein AD428_20295 [Achromobacter sp. DMS1]KOF54205.1 hypothetical protein AD428_08595 [Achromobacter sp. DMS1]KOF54275.1 hypothetical protein AD428_08180 [Achromobacter sp. DMS1]
MDLPTWAWWAIGLGLFVVIEACVALWFIRKQVQRRQEAAAQVEQVRRTGDPASALVLEATDTGKRLGAYTYFVVKLRLRVTPAAGEAFETEINANISPVRIPDFAEGKVIAVRVDPRTRAVAVDQRTQ